SPFWCGLSGAPGCVTWELILDGYSESSYSATPRFAAARLPWFPNFSLGEEYEHAPPATNRQISPYLPSGRFRTGLPVEGLAIERGDLFYACPRASVFYGTALDADLRTRGVSTLVMAGISTTGVVLSSVAWASDADYDVRLVQDCCYDPDRDAHEALLRSGFGGRVQVV
ncbi:isochorismatase family cysteine hydrolase, partial [Escherichia coli]